MTLSDTSTWLPLDGLAPGFDANKAPAVDDLRGREFVLRDGNGPLRTWTGADPGETFLVDDDLYYVQVRPAEREAVSLFLDLRDGRALVVTTTIGDHGTPRVTQEFRPATI